MAQEDKGLVLRGLLLLTAIGCLVAFVLAIVFWRPGAAPTPTLEVPPEYRIPLVIIPNSLEFPSAISWLAIQNLGETLPSAPGFGVRYNAAATLARRGSDQVPWHLIREMLDEKQQLRNQRVRMPDGRDVYDEATARAYMITALKALAAWHEKRNDQSQPPPPEVRDIYAVVEQLTHSPFVELKVQAEKTRGTFARR